MSLMPTFKVESFYDPQPILKNVYKARRKVGRRLGGLVRKIARDSIVTDRSAPGKKGKTSRPGNPPIGHTRILKNSIFYAYDPSTGDTICGPLRFRSARGNTGSQSLEFGGPVKTSRGVKRIKARPFMLPALKKASLRLAEFWREAI